MGCHEVTVLNNKGPANCQLFILYYLQRAGSYPALATVGKGNVLPGADLVKYPDLGTFVDDKEILGRTA